MGFIAFPPTSLRMYIDEKFVPNQVREGKTLVCAIKGVRNASSSRPQMGNVEGGV